MCDKKAVAKLAMQVYKPGKLEQVNSMSATAANS